VFRANREKKEKKNTVQAEAALESDSDNNTVA
jgi:hypothetical protein